MSNHNCYTYSDQNGTYCLPYDEIIWIEADGNYVQIHVIDEGKVIVISKTLKKVEMELERQDQFFRIDKSYIINLDYFDRLLNKDGGTVVLKNKMELMIARRRKRKFYNRIKLL